jgi:hypothetical protein
MEAVRSSEKLVNFWYTILCHIPEYSRPALHSHCSRTQNPALWFSIYNSTYLFNYWRSSHFVGLKRSLSSPHEHTTVPRDALRQVSPAQRIITYIHHITFNVFLPSINVFQVSCFHDTVHISSATKKNSKKQLQLHSQLPLIQKHICPPKLN